MYIGAINLGGTKSICAVCDQDYTILASKTFKTTKASPEILLGKCADTLKECLSELNLTFSNLQGIGISLPGMVSPDEILLYAPFLDWRDTDVKSIIKELTGVLKVRCDCDVNNCALAEVKTSQYNNFLWLTVSTGIGGAIVINNTVFKGAHGLAGEIGHIKVEYDTPKRCSCGQYGCAEAHASGTALTNAVIEMCSVDSQYNALYETYGLSRDAVGCSKLARDGETRSIALFNQVGDFLGRAISAAVNVLDVQAVFIGGGMSRSLDLFLPALKQRLKNSAIPFLQDIPILPTALGYNASLSGAFMLIGEE